MSSNIIISLSDLPTRKDAPTMVKLFSWGTNKTTKGEFILTKESADQIIQAWKDYGNKLNIDYNHAQLTSVNPDESISAGTFDLELRDNGLFAINIEWTSKAKSLVEAKEYIYISPAFLTNENNEVVELINFALTNIPATKNMDQLIAAFKLYMEKTNMEDEQKVEEVTLSEEVVEETVLAETPAEEVFDIKSAFEELKAMVLEIKSMVDVAKSEEEMEPEEIPVEKMSIEEDKKEEVLSIVSDLKKENMILLGIIGKKILPSETDKLKTLSVEELDKEIGSRKQINLTNSKQLIDTSKALVSEDKSVDEAFRDKLKKQLKF